jgi:apolipoprotein N-acyltransferase
MDPRAPLAFALASFLARVAGHLLYLAASNEMSRADWIFRAYPLSALALSQGLSLALYLLLRKPKGWFGLATICFAVALTFRVNALVPYLHLQEARISLIIDIVMWLTISIVAALSFSVFDKKRP